MKGHKGALTCSVCGKAFLSRQGLWEHERNHSVDKKKFQCEICNTYISRATQLECHMNSKHLNIKPYKCQACTKAFVTMQTLKRHQKECKGAQPFERKCTVCDKVFQTYSALREHHTAKHSGKTFICSCGASYVWRASFVRHLAASGHPKIGVEQVI